MTRETFHLVVQADVAPGCFLMAPAVPKRLRRCIYILHFYSEVNEIIEIIASLTLSAHLATEWISAS